MRLGTVERYADEPRLSVLVAGKGRLLPDVPEEYFLEDVVGIRPVLRSRIGQPVHQVAIGFQYAFRIWHSLPSFLVFCQ